MPSLALSCCVEVTINHQRLRDDDKPDVDARA